MSIRVNDWYKNAAAIILAGGKGTRAKPATDFLPKCLLPVNGKPILAHISDYWCNFIRPTNFYVVANKDSYIPIKMYSDYLFIAPTVIMQAYEGIFSALLSSRELLPKRFLVILGDCLVDGVFDIPAGMEIGIGVIESDNQEEYKKNYSVWVQPANRCNYFEEHPENARVASYCGLGYYFFDDRIWDYIRDDMQSITELLQAMADAGEHIYPVELKPRYTNIGTVADLESW
jgi:mannose-1-phosphate guanylyltransferase